MFQDQPEYFTREQLAKVLYVSVSTIDRLCRAGDLSSIKIGHRVLFRRAEVEAFIDRNSRTCTVTSIF